MDNKVIAMILVIICQLLLAFEAADKWEVRKGD